jgi:hypothetical protein
MEEVKKIIKNNKFIVIIVIILLGVFISKRFFVSPPPAPIPKCDKGNTDFDCYQTYYTKLVEARGVAAAFSDIKKDYSSNSYVQSQCHQLTHVIGHAAVTLYSDVNEAFEHGDPFCWSGYYHGVMEELVEKVGLNKVKTELDNICSGIPGKSSYSFDYYNCVHGLGHGLMAVTDDEVFQSLKLCDNLSGSWEESSCYGGVFMQNVINDGVIHQSKYLKPEDPLYPCNAVEGRYKTSCYLMQSSYMLKVENYDFSKVFPLCRQADSGYKDTCFQSLGRDASGQSISDPVRTKNTCEMGKDFSEKSNCIIGAVKDFISYYHSDIQAKKLCSILSTDLKAVCSDTAVSYYSTFK